MCRIGWIALTVFVLTGAAGAAAPPKKTAATPAEALQTLPGFKVELIHTSDPKTEGSWINMATDDKGRLIISGQRNQPILRVTLKDGQVEKIEKLDLPISEAMGLLYAFDSLYVDGAGPGGYGLYRCKDTKGTDQFDEVKLLKKFNNGGGDHGAHAVVLGPDKMLYVPARQFLRRSRGHGPRFAAPQLRRGSAPAAPAGRQRLRGRPLRPRRHRPPHRPRRQEVGPDARRLPQRLRHRLQRRRRAVHLRRRHGVGLGHGRGIGRSASTTAPAPPSSAGATAPASGRNTIPTASAPSSTSASARRPAWSSGRGPSSRPSIRRRSSCCDWTYGRLFAVHLTPKGSSYTAEFENFLAPKSLKGDGPKTPLNLTDVVIGDDGAIYFTTGGRNTQSGLYRISYTGTESTAPADLHDEAGAKERASCARSWRPSTASRTPRRSTPPGRSLNSDDRVLRYAARIAVECQPVAEWKARRWRRSSRTAALTALLALARCGAKEVQPDLLAAAGPVPARRPDGGPAAGEAARAAADLHPPGAADRRRRQEGRGGAGRPVSDQERERES